MRGVDLMSPRGWVIFDYVLWYMSFMVCLLCGFTRYDMVYYGMFGGVFGLIVIHILSGESVTHFCWKHIKCVKEQVARRRAGREEKRREEHERMKSMIRHMREIYREEMTND